LKKPSVELIMRKALERRKKRKQTAIPNDIARDGEVPMKEQLEFMVGQLSDIRRANIEDVVCTVMEVLQERRMKDKDSWLNKHPTHLVDYKKRKKAKKDFWKKHSATETGFEVQAPFNTAGLGGGGTGGFAI
jgi:hypothetical protein